MKPEDTKELFFDDSPSVSKLHGCIITHDESRQLINSLAEIIWVKITVDDRVCLVSVVHDLLSI